MHPTVIPAWTTAPDVYDDRTRHACVTRGEGSCVPTEPAREEPVLDTSSSAFFSLVARAELSVTRGALSHSQCQVESGLARVGIDEKIYSFLVLFWQRVQPRVDGWRRAQPVGCDGIRHSRVISSCTNTLLPLRVCPRSMYTRRRSCPAGLGSASDSDDFRLARRPGCSSNQPLSDSYPEDRTHSLVLLVRVGGGVGVGLRELLLRQLGGTRGGRHPFREHL